MENGCQIILIQGRLKFNDTGTAPFPSMFVQICENRKNEMLYLTKEKVEEIIK